MKVEKQRFDAILGKLIATPASAKDGIKKPSAAKRPVVRKSSRSTPRT